MDNADEIMGHDWLNLSSYTHYCLKTLRRVFTSRSSVNLAITTLLGQRRDMRVRNIIAKLK